MSKIKITEPGWEKYTGLFGITEFVDGVSTESLSRMESARLGGIIRMELVDTGANPSVSQQVLDSQTQPMALASLPTQDQPTYEAPATPTEAHTVVSLELIADKFGIKGLRVISDPLGLKANSISELIAKILESQSAEAPAAETEQTPAQGE